MIDALDFLYIVLALGVIPVFILLSMVLWRTYKILGHTDEILDTVDATLNFFRNIDKVPTMISHKITSGFNNFFRRR